MKVNSSFVLFYFIIFNYRRWCVFEQLAAVLAIIRPAKRGLMYKNWVDILKDVWIKPTDGSYFFKKSHAVAYAHAIVVQMNLIRKAKYSFSATQET